MTVNENMLLRLVALYQLGSKQSKEDKGLSQKHETLLRSKLDEIFEGKRCGNRNAYLWSL